MNAKTKITITLERSKTGSFKIMSSRGAVRPKACSSTVIGCYDYFEVGQHLNAAEAERLVDNPENVVIVRASR